MAATRCRRGRDDVLRFNLSFRVRRKGDLGDFEGGVFVCAGWRNCRSAVDFPTQPVWKRENTQWASVLWVKMPCWYQRSDENGQTALTWEEGDSDSNIHSFQSRYAEEQMKQKTTLVSTRVSWEEKTEATFCKVSPKLDFWVQIWWQCESRAPSCLVSTVYTAAGGVMGGDYFLSTLCHYLSIVVHHVHQCMTTVYPAG